MKRIISKFLPKDFFIIVFGALFVSSIFLIPGLINISKGIALKSYYSDTEIDFIVMSPGKNQCQEIEELPFIDLAIPFYRTNVEIESHRKSFADSDVLIFDGLYDLEKFFSSKRIIAEASNIQEFSIAYLDYSASKKYGLKEGDTFIITVFNQKFEFYVSKIFESSFNGDVSTPMVMLYANDSLRYLLSVYPFSGAYIKASDYNLASKYFNSEYIAKGDLRERDQFESDVAYTQYNNAVLNAKHYVIDMRRLGDVVLSFSNHIQTGFIYCSLGIFFDIVLLAVIFLRKSSNKIISSYFLSLSRIGINKRQLIREINFLFCIEAFISKIVYLLMFIISYKLFYFPSYSILIYLIALMLVLSIIEAFCITRLIASKITYMRDFNKIEI